MTRFPHTDGEGYQMADLEPGGSEAGHVFGVVEPPPMLGMALAAVALGIFALFAIGTASQLLPPRLLDTTWQLRAATALIEAGPFALIGLVLLQLGAHLDPANTPLQVCWHRLGRLGVVAVLGFLLLIPLQLVAAGLTLQTAGNVQRRQELRMERTVSRLRQQIRAASSFPDLQRRIRDIPAPDLVVPAEALQAPLPQLKRQLLASVDQGERRLRRNLAQARAPQRTRSLLQSIVRGAVSALVLALCFTAATPLWDTPEVSLLLHWYWSLGRVLHPREAQESMAVDGFLQGLGHEDEPLAQDPGPDAAHPPSGPPQQSG